MRKFSIAVVGLLFAVTGCQPPDSSTDDEVGSISADLSTGVPIGSTLATTAALNLRTGAGTGFAILRVMPLGSHVITLNRTTPVSGFFNVSYNGTTGWASGTYLRLVSSPATPPTPDAGTSSPPDAGSPGAWTPAAKGLWIWYFAYTGYTAAQVAEMAQADGVGYVLIKSGQDGTFWDTRYNAATVAEFTSRGMKVFAWPYITPSNISGSIAAAVKAAQVPGTSGLVLDVEVEFEGSFATAAKTLCQGIRAGAPNVWLGYTSFGWVGFHSTFPYSTFDEYCGDGFFPQVYWSDRGVSWSFGYTQAQQQLASSGLHAPVWMVQSNDNTPSGAAPSTADLNSFYGQSGTFSSLWEFPGSGFAAKVPQLADLHWAN